MFDVRINDHEDRLTADEWEERVRAGRIPGDALVRFDPVTGDAFVRADQLELYRSLAHTAEATWREQFKNADPPVMTALLVGIQVRIWLLSWLGESGYWMTVHLTNWSAPIFEDGEVWRLFTMGFLHTEFFHITLNLIWLGYTGVNLERAIGRTNLLALYLVSVFGGSVLSMLGTPESPSLGASGGVFGLIAASVMFGFTRPNLVPSRGRELFGFALLPYLLMMFWSGLMNEGTDNWCHLGGLLSGGLYLLLLDPPVLQRRPRWNRHVYVGTALVFALSLETLGTFGPQLTPLSAPSLEESPQSDGLSFTRPRGWRPGFTNTNHAGFRSPSPAGERVWSVTLRRSGVPRRPKQVGTQMRSQLSAIWPDATFGPLLPSRVADRDGFTRRITLGDDQGQVIHWSFALRGQHELHQVWQVDAASEEQLNALFSRLKEDVHWRDPSSLVDARLNATRLPDSLDAQLQRCEQLTEWGLYDEAIEGWSSLRRDTPSAQRALRGLIRAARWAPNVPLDRETLWNEALGVFDDYSSLIEVILSLEAADRDDEAFGLLEIAWARSPGNRVLAAARKKRGRPYRKATYQTDSGSPYSVAIDPLTGQPRAEPTLTQTTPLTLEDAQKVTQAYRAERETLASAITQRLHADDTSVAPLIIYLKHGYIPDAVASAIPSVLSDLGEEDAPPWLPPSLNSQRPTLITHLNEEARRP